MKFPTDVGFEFPQELYCGAEVAIKEYAPNPPVFCPKPTVTRNSLLGVHAPAEIAIYKLDRVVRMQLQPVEVKEP